MSVLVKGMRMPENCNECMSSDLRTAIKCTEWTEISAGRRKNERAWSCPLVELPETCDTCKHSTDVYDSEFCDGCTQANSNWELMWEGE